jgi:hypothetical protein
MTLVIDELKLEKVASWCGIGRWQNCRKVQRTEHMVIFRKGLIVTGHLHLSTKISHFGCVWQYWVWTWGFVFARHMFYCLTCVLSPFCFGCIWDRVLFFAWLAWTMILLFTLLACQHTHLLLLRWDLVNFLFLLAWNRNHPDLSLLSS